MNEKRIHEQPEGGSVMERDVRPAFGPFDLTPNELAWVEFLRLIGNGRDFGPTLERVQLLRRVCERR